MAAAPARQHGIATRTLRGVLWVYGSYVGGRLLVLASTAILARLLTPGDFGVVALALTFMALLEAVSDLGLSQAIVVVPDDEVLDRADTAFFGTVGMGLGLSLIIAALGPVAAAFFHEDALNWVVPALGANFLLRSFGSTHYGLARREMDFRSRTIAEFADVLVRGSVGVALALAGAGVASLVAGYLVGTVALVIVMWWRVPWRPRPRIVRAHLRELLGFGSRLSAVDLLNAVITNVDYVFVGRLLGATALGIYTLGWQLPELIIINVSLVAAQVLFPAFASVDREALGRAYLISLRYTLLVGLPLAAGLAVLAEPFIIAAFGDQWRDSVVPMQVLTIYATGVTLGMPAGAAYKATGRAGFLLRLAVAKAVMAVASIAAFTHLGIVAVAGCQAASTAIVDLVGIFFAARLLAVGLPAIAAEAWPSATGALGMAAVMWVIQAVVDSPWPALITGGLAGVLVYAGVVILLAGPWLDHLRDTMFPARFTEAPRPARAHEPDLVG